MRVLVVDNFDSFVFTLAGYLSELGADVTVQRNDVADPARIRDWDAVLLSPGPGAPADAGSSIGFVHASVASGVPLFGVCLGHQAIAEAFGGVVSHAEELMHGKTSTVVHEETPLFAGLPQRFTATRYHSLAVEDASVPEQLRVTARTAHPDADRGVIMALEHVSAPVWGVQYHPESILTEGGYRMLGNWLEFAGLRGAVELSTGKQPRMD
ncbi:MAG TPA: gamma-glutamyl-gamma-aminobutyrate hydrolase family protein [Candidatus Agrococcus pullicola]|uniref:Gamma-glutamyl-gamma-aminobutyrate hydrolase family protein n=1 Tax=Candidatus Agrococcus pullicola TaxID=2838429 RepID=A0A9D1YVA7_9MICO|nr:gamma-glutamyl-gamma-aminobutyrate hydrolase family protein [Candidatus Agrococcus pullicola]